MLASPSSARSNHAEDSGFLARPGFDPFFDEAAPGTVVDRLVTVGAKHADRTALVEGQWRLTYRELVVRAQDRGRHVAAALGDRQGPVAIHATTQRAAIDAILGVLWAGRPYLCLPPQTAPAALEDILRAASAAAVLDDDAIVVRPLERTAPVGSADLACLFATSGTTGTPKMVGLSHRAVLFDIARQTTDLYLGPDDRIDLLWHPSFSASLASVFSALLNGAELHLGSPSAPGQPLLEWLAQAGITITSMTVSRLRLLCAASSGARDLRHLRLVSVGGEALMARDVRAFQATFPEGCVLQNAMASTETRTYAQYFVRTGTAVDDPVPIGWPVKGKTVIVTDADGQILPPGEDGEILVRSRYLADGYVNDVALSSARFLPQPDGAVLFRTGDRGRFRDDGCLVFLGRSDSLLKIRGYRVSPESVEHALLADDRIREAAVVAVPRGAGEQVLAAVVALEPGCHAGERQLVEAVSCRLPSYALPTSVGVVHALPRNQNGKIDYRAIAARLQAESPARPGAPIYQVQQLCEAWGRALGRPPVASDDDFFASGGDSLRAVRLQIEVRHQLGLELPLSQLAAHPTPRMLAESLAGAAPPRHPALVVLHQGGTGTPLFCVPGIGGEPEGFTHLADHIGPDRPIFGFRATLATEPVDRVTAIEDIAREYVAAIDTVVPRHHSVHLCGHSFGGLVALEMAHQLLGSDRPLGSFVIIDTPLGAGRPGYVGRLRDTARNLPAWLWYDALRSRPHALYVRVVAKAATLMKEMQSRMTGRPREAYPDFRSYFGVTRLPSELLARLRTRYSAARRHIRRPLPIPIVLLRSRAQALMGRSDRCLGWDALATHVTVFDVPGHHDSCYKPPHVKTLATVLAQQLREREGV